jgi:hypothetical protein
MVEALIFLVLLIFAIAAWPIVLWFVIAWACFALHWAVGVIFVCLTVFAFAANN